MSNVALPSIPDPITVAQKESVPFFSTECRSENIEQYNRRDCLLFFDLTECETEDCVDKIVETAYAMGVTIMHDDVSVSHRLHTRNRRSDETGPIIAKFTRLNTKNLIYVTQYRLKFSENHYNVFVCEQLTKERARALYWMKDEGYKVNTYEIRLLFRPGQESGVVNILSELGTKLGWQAIQLEKVFKE